MLYFATHFFVGVTGEGLQWFKDYLNNQVVEANSQLSFYCSQFSCYFSVCRQRYHIILVLLLAYYRPNCYVYIIVLVICHTFLHQLSPSSDALHCLICSPLSKQQLSTKILYTFVKMFHTQYNQTKQNYQQLILP